jgi:Zn-dependent peptidase ImmA (M78 family)
LHSGNQLSFHGWQKISLRKQEREAEECAAHILIPEEELAKLGSVLVWEIAEYFGVPEELARQRVTEFAADRETIRRETPR